MLGAALVAALYIASYLQADEKICSPWEGFMLFLSDRRQVLIYKTVISMFGNRLLPSAYCGCENSPVIIGHGRCNFVSKDVVVL